MNIYSWIQIVFYMTVLLLLAKPLGAYMAKVYQGERVFLDHVLGPVERFIYRLSSIDSHVEMDWKIYAVAMLTFNLLGLITVYLLQRLQGMLPLNPQATWRSDTRLFMEYRSQLCVQYQLAGLWRRNNDELSHTNAWYDRAELRLRCDGDGGISCFHSWNSQTYIPLTW